MTAARPKAEGPPQPLAGEPAARVLVAGASGLAGSLAAELVWRHPRLELAAATARSEAGTRLDRLHPRRRVPLYLDELDLDELEAVDAAIVGYPHGASAPVVAGLRGLGALVVDLSADFRLRDLPSYERWYGPHGDPDLLEGAVYGLTELHRDAVRAGELVASPGCYATAAVLALAPLAAAGLAGDVVISAASGVSGAGRGAVDYVDVSENFTAYAVDGHRHLPEIEQELAAAAAAGANAAPPHLTFVPHLLPIDQGLLASCFVTPARAVSGDELRVLYEERYGAEPFVELVDAPPGVRDVRDTNVCRLFVAAIDGGDRIACLAAIDNLWKGAAGQAVQNLNLMLGLAETEGLG
jgi:N-acetyl-gamma-glutamyl-phosphate reductase